MRRHGFVSAAAALLAGACAMRPVSRGPRPALSPLAPPESYYEAGGTVPVPLSDVVEERRTPYEVRRVMLPPRVPDALTPVPRSGDPIDVLWYRPLPETGPRPLVLISPILGNRRLLVTMFASRFAAMGYHAAIVFRKELEFDPGSTIDRAEDELRLIVMRSRQAVDWLALRPDVDATRIGVFGVSAGAVLGAVSLGTDARLRAGVLYTGGGPFADVVSDTAEERFLRYGRLTQRALGLTKEQARTRLRETVRSDPVLVAPRVPRDDVLLVVARNDRSVPVHTGYALWEAMGHPQLVVTPFGHHTTWVLLPWLETLAADWFRARFGEPVRAEAAAPPP